MKRENLIVKLSDIKLNEHNPRIIKDKQMANDGYARFATDEEMKGADMVPTEVKHVYKDKEEYNAKKA